MKTDLRGISPVIGVVLIVALTIILSVSVFMFTIDLTENVNDPAPVVGETTGEFTTADGVAGDEQAVRINHISGDNVRVEEIEIIVRASGPDLDTEARLVDLPSDGHHDRSIDASNIQGNEDLIDSGSEKARIIVVEDSDVWKSGSSIEFRVAVTGADFRDPPVSGPAADELEVIIVHTESDTVIFEDTFNA